MDRRRPNSGDRAGAISAKNSTLPSRSSALSQPPWVLLAGVRKAFNDAHPEIVEEWKYMGTPVWSHAGMVCTGETYKNIVKMTFAKGAALRDPSGPFNSSLNGNVRRAIDIHEGDKVDEAALTDLIRAAVALNLEVKSKPKPRQASSKRA